MFFKRKPSYSYQRMRNNLIITLQFMSICTLEGKIESVVVYSLTIVHKFLTKPFALRNSSIYNELMNDKLSQHSAAMITGLAYQDISNDTPTTYK